MAQGIWTDTNNQRTHTMSNNTITTWEAIRYFTGKQTVMVVNSSEEETKFYSVDLGNLSGCSGTWKYSGSGTVIEYIATADVKTKAWRGPRSVVLQRCITKETGHVWYCWTSMHGEFVETERMEHMEHMEHKP